MSKQGKEAALTHFKWIKATTLNRKELEEARIDFVRHHPELHDKPHQLARELRADGLWSDTTEISVVARQMPKFIVKAAE